MNQSWKSPGKVTQPGFSPSSSSSRQNGEEIIRIHENPNDNTEQALRKSFESLVQIEMILNSDSDQNPFDHLSNLRNQLKTIAFHTNSGIPRKYVESYQSITQESNS